MCVGGKDELIVGNFQKCSDSIEHFTSVFYRGCWFLAFVMLPFDVGVILWWATSFIYLSLCLLKCVLYARIGVFCTVQDNENACQLWESSSRYDFNCISCIWYLDIFWLFFIYIYFIYDFSWTCHRFIKKPFVAFMELWLSISSKKALSWVFIL